MNILDLFKKERSLSENPYVDVENRILYLCEDVDGENGLGFMRGLHQLVVTENPVTIVINSPGGDVSWGHAMAQAVRAYPNVMFEARVYGEACSAAVFPLLACQNRIGSEGSVVMVHGLTTYNSGDVRNQEADAKANRDIIEYQAELLASRTKHNAAHWRKVLKDNTPVYYTAKEALAEGFIDSIAG